MLRLTAVALAAACLLQVRLAAATVVLDLPLPELAGRSALVIRGVVEGQRAAWDEAHQRIYTRVTIRITETWRGAVRVGSHVVVNQPGGEVGGVGQHVEGVARFRVGEDVVAFLEPHRARRGEYTLVSLAASKFSVALDAAGQSTAVRDVSALTFASRGTDGFVRVTTDRPVATLPLGSLRATVRATTRTSTTAGPR